MKNIYNSEAYQKSKLDLEKYYTEENFVSSGEHVEFNNYSLDISYYKTEEGCWNVSRGIISKNNNIIVDIKRNYSSFLYLFFCHSNNNDYLICGEDYQGYTIVNLSTGKTNTYIPETWSKGWGFCWISIEDYDDKIKVEGCYWGAPYEIVIYDFSNPDVLPLPEIDRYYTDPDEDEDDDEE